METRLENIWFHATDTLSTQLSKAREFHSLLLKTLKLSSGLLKPKFRVATWFISTIRLLKPPK